VTNIYEGDAGMFILTQRKYGEIKPLSGIYYYENLINGKRYVGQSVKLGRRIQKHEGAFRRSTCPYGENQGLWNAVKKYGRENFSLHIEYAQESELDELEVKYIKSLCSHYTEHGYNVYWGGDHGARGVVIKESTKEKLSKLFSGVGNPFFGKSHTAEANERNRQAHLGRTNSVSARKKMGDATRGTKKTTSTRYLGVTFVPHNKRNRWRGFITLSGKFTHLGYFSTEIDAACAYDAYVVKNKLPNPLNFPGNCQ
jgi:group I intron endonuclease